MFVVVGKGLAFGVEVSGRCCAGVDESSVPRVGSLVRRSYCGVSDGMGWANNAGGLYLPRTSIER